jgi:hypothetical protein
MRDKVVNKKEDRERFVNKREDRERFCVNPKKIKAGLN